MCVNSSFTHGRIRFVHTKCEVILLEEMKKEYVADEWNSFLKGCHNVANTFDHMRDQIRSKELHGVFTQMLDMLHTHERSLIALMISIDAEVESNTRILDRMSDAMQSLASLRFSNDQEILEEALRVIEKATTMLHQFNEKHLVMEKGMEKTVHIMHDDYRCIYHMLHKRIIEFR